MMMDRPVQDRGPRVNERIRVREVRVVDADGSQLGVLPTDQALARAKEQGLDLVEVAAKSRPPVCKIMDYGKYKYEMKLKKRQNAKKQHKVVLKEVRLRPKTGEHDYQVKIKHARRFLLKGYKVQVNVLFRGRERAHTDIAKGHLERMAEDLEEIAKVESPPKMEGYRMIMILAPTPNAAKIAARERKEREAEAGKKGRKEKKSRRNRDDASEASAEALASESALDEGDEE
ncbi:MAG: translation initiation factor IF-3 [Planctomycetota bacterium]|nr:MAG: translation initiation factor IF-3 [Planctomycetota bacterium]